QNVTGGERLEKRPEPVAPISKPDLLDLSGPFRIAPPIDPDRFGRGPDFPVTGNRVVRVRVGEDRAWSRNGRIQVRVEGRAVETLRAVLEKGKEPVSHEEIESLNRPSFSSSRKGPPEPARLPWRHAAAGREEEKPAAAEGSSHSHLRFSLSPPCSSPITSAGRRPAAEARTAAEVMV